VGDAGHEPEHQSCGCASAQHEIAETGLQTPAGSTREGHRHPIGARAEPLEAVPVVGVGHTLLV
jgi:hypothetical protein